jgi:hypothetical protein
MKKWKLGCMLMNVKLKRWNKKEIEWKKKGSFQNNYSNENGKINGCNGWVK